MTDTTEPSASSTAHTLDTYSISIFCGAGFGQPLPVFRPEPQGVSAVWRCESGPGLNAEIDAGVAQ